MTVRDLPPLPPDPAELRARCLGIALLDSVLDGHAATRAFARDRRPGVDPATTDNGSGDQYAVVSEPAGAFLYGFDHESDAGPWREEDREHRPGPLDGQPASLAHCARTPESAFDGFFDATVCAWRASGDATGA
ncbi:hypothetical protein ACIQ9P_26145 [Kitasatospora sp. NPDC094019]|uniref:hypothetical protein n=1 Tax=Kitasatospora sp. NPDC094019 TaxID=3364091 RepID=UPI0038100254